MSNDEQPYILLVVNEDGHFILAKACESESDGFEKARKYDRGDNDVSLIPCDGFEGFDKDL